MNRPACMGGAVLIRLSEVGGPTMEEKYLQGILEVLP